MPCAPPEGLSRVQRAPACRWAASAKRCPRASLRQPYFGQRRHGQGGRLRSVILVVSGLLISDQGQALVAQRPQGKRDAGRWEFPGGKVDTHETPEQGLIRELEEELGVQVRAEDLQPLSFATREKGNASFLLCLYRVAAWAGEPRGAEGQVVRWEGLEALRRLPLSSMDATFLPLVEAACQAHATSGLSLGT